MQNPDKEEQKNFFSMAESLESEKISSSSSEWNLGLDELFVTCLNENSENEIAKTIENYFSPNY